jgi:DNA-binding protein H-NS
MNDKGDIMSEEIKNEDVVEETPIILATLQEGEPLITADMAEKFESIKEEIFAEKVEEPVEEPTIEEVKPVEAEEPKNVISSGSQRTGKKSEEVAGITAVENGVIGTGTVKPKPKNVVKQQDKPEVEKVAIYSSKNVTWTGVGKVYRGYNIVTKEAADKWLTRDHTRVATPEELAKEFGR